LVTTHFKLDRYATHGCFLNNYPARRHHPNIQVVRELAHIFLAGFHISPLIIRSQHCISHFDRSLFTYLVNRKVLLAALVVRARGGIDCIAAIVAAHLGHGAVDETETAIGIVPVKKTRFMRRSRGRGLGRV
jgi:hypothetical protein